MSTSGIESADAISNPEFNKLNKNNFGDSSVSVGKDQNKAETPAKTPGALPTKKTDLKRRNSMSELPTLKSQPKNKSDDETSKIELQKKVETPKESNKDSASPADGGAVTSKASNASRKDKESPSAPGQIFFTAEEAKDKPNVSKYTIKLHGALAGDFSLWAKFSLTNSNEQESFYIYVDSTGKVIEGGKQYPAETQMLVDEFLKKVERSKDFLSPDPNLRREIGEDWYRDGTSVSKVVRKEEIIKENFFIDDSIAKKFFEKLQKKIRKSGSQKPQDQANSKNTENKKAEATKEGKNEKPEQKENPAKENSVNSEQEKNLVKKGNSSSEDTAAETKVKNSENSDKNERTKDDLEPKLDVDDETNAFKEADEKILAEGNPTESGTKKNISEDSLNTDNTGVDINPNPAPEENVFSDEDLGALLNTDNAGVDDGSRNDDSGFTAEVSKPSSKEEGTLEDLLGGISGDDDDDSDLILKEGDGSSDEENDITEDKSPGNSDEAKSTEHGTEGSTSSGNELNPEGDDLILNYDSELEDDTSLENKTEDGSKDQEKEIKDDPNALEESGKIEDSTSAETSSITPEDKKADASPDKILWDYSEGADTPGKIKCEITVSKDVTGAFVVGIRYGQDLITVFSDKNGAAEELGNLCLNVNSFGQDSKQQLSLEGKELVKVIFEKEGQNIANGLSKKDNDARFISFSFRKNFLVDESYIKGFFETKDANSEGNNDKAGAKDSNDNIEPKNGARNGNNMPISPNESEVLPLSTDELNVTKKPNDLLEDAEVDAVSDEIVHDLNENGNDQDKVKCLVSISSLGDSGFKVSVKAGAQGNIDIFVDFNVAFNHSNPNLRIKEVRYASRSNGIPLEIIKQTSAAKELVNKIFGKISDISSLTFGNSLKKKFAISKSDIEGVIKPKDATAAEDVNAGQVVEGQALGNEINVKPLNFSELSKKAVNSKSNLIKPHDTVGAKIRNFFFNIFMGLAALFNGERRFKSNKKTADKAKNALKSILDGISVKNATFNIDVKDTPRDGNCMLWSTVASLSDFNLPSPSKSELSEARNLVIPYLRSEIAEEKETTNTKRANRLRRRVGVGAESIEPAEMGPVAEALGRNIVIISDPDGKGSQPTLLLHTSDGELINPQDAFFNEDNVIKIMGALSEGIVIYAAKGHARAVNVSGLQYKIDNGSDNNTLDEASEQANKDSEAEKGSSPGANAIGQGTESSAGIETGGDFVFVGKPNNDQTRQGNP